MTDLRLTPTEQVAIRALNDRWAAQQRLQQQDAAALLREVERRLGLPEGAFGTTHEIDLGASAVVARAASPD